MQERTRPGKFQEWHLLNLFILLILDLRQSAKLEEKLYLFSNKKVSIECLFQMCVCCIIGIIAGGDRLADSTQGWHLVRAMSGLWPV